MQKPGTMLVALLSALLAVTFLAAPAMAASKTRSVWPDQLKPFFAEAADVDQTPNCVGTTGGAVHYYKMVTFPAGATFTGIDFLFHGEDGTSLADVVLKRYRNATTVSADVATAEGLGYTGGEILKVTGAVVPDEAEVKKKGRYWLQVRVDNIYSRVCRVNIHFDVPE